MGKKFYTRKCKRPSGLSTTDAIHKMLMQVYWAKIAGKPYNVSVICDNEHIGHINKGLVEKACSWENVPTREEAEALRIAFIEHCQANWNKKKVATPETEPMLDFVGSEEAQHCNDFGILEWNGHRYRLVPID